MAMWSLKTQRPTLQKSIIVDGCCKARLRSLSTTLLIMVLPLPPAPCKKMNFWTDCVNTKTSRQSD
jgi:hypothetical protein